MTLNSSPKVQAVFDRYPEAIKPKLLQLRQWILDSAEAIDDLELLEETLKWGEPSYLTKNGSTIRMDWKAKQPGQYALYFSCSTSLVATFRAIFKDVFVFEGNRAIVFGLEEPLPEQEIKQCLSMALRYHKVKHLPFLGGS
jgi:hypothetical protein